MNAASRDESHPRGIRLDQIVPWGRGLAEYERMFLLVNIDGSSSPHLEPLLSALHGAGYRTERRLTQYRMQKGEEHFLVATAQSAGTS